MEESDVSVAAPAPAVGCETPVLVGLGSGRHRSSSPVLFFPPVAGATPALELRATSVAALKGRGLKGGSVS